MAGKPSLGIHDRTMGGGDLRRQITIIGTAASAGAIALAGGLLIGGTSALAQLRIEPSVSVSETFSDNVDRDPDGEGDEAFITEVSPSIALRWNTGRLTATVDAGLAVQHQTKGDDEGIEVLPEAAGLGSAELWREHLFFDASAAASTELLNTRNQDTESNRSIIQTYRANPRLLGKFGSFADVETFYQFTQVIDEGGGSNTGDDIGDEQEHEIGATLSAGPDFTRIRWALSGTASEAERENQPNVSRREGLLNLEYIVDRTFTVLGGVGYQEFDDGDATNEVSGVIWDAGFRWRPGPRTDVTVTYGRRDDSNSFTANGRHRITPQTSVFASYDEVLETGQERLAQDLSFISTDPNTGQLIDSRTGQPFDPQTSITTVDDDTQRTKTFRAGIAGTRGRNTFGLTGSFQTTRDVGTSTTGEEEDAYQVTANWGRRLSTRANLGTAVSYSRNEFATDNLTDNEYSAEVTYSYNIFQNVNAFGTYEFATQDSTNEAEEFVENRVTVGLAVRF